MLKIEGKFNTATVYANSLENSAVGQLKALCNQDFVRDSQLRIMPDAHAGAGCIVGTTMTIFDKIVPNLVGVDIGCGMEVVNIGDSRMDFQKLDRIIRKSVPSGFAIRKAPHRFASEIDLGDLTCAKAVNREKAINSIGTLGGGNHFIEIAKDENSGDYFLIVHSGSRQAGLQVANHHQKIAGDMRMDDVPYELSYLIGDRFDAYIHDMGIMVEYASINRKAIADEILKGMKWKAGESFTTIHNYLDSENMILRKGAVSAQKGEKLLIPMNMRDGSLICEGLGNQDWNFSAPHGAGRLFSRLEAKNRITLTQFKKDMEGIYSTSISRQTIDESPAAYKPMQDILDQIGDTVKILSILKPVYNFKAESA